MVKREKNGTVIVWSSVGPERDTLKDVDWICPFCFHHKGGG